jgi:hypothetical protein
LKSPTYACCKKAAANPAIGSGKMNDPSPPMPRVPRQHPLDNSVPTRLIYLEGTLEQRMQRLFEYYRLHFTFPQGAPKIIFDQGTIETTDELRLLGVSHAIIKGFRGSYIASLNLLYLSEQVTDRFNAPSLGARVGALRIINHELWHALRFTESSKFLPVEEGGAEVFTNEITRRMTGIDVSGEAITDYLGLSKGMQLLGKLFMPFYPWRWALLSRRVTDQRLWLAEELQQLGGTPHQIQLLLTYDLQQDAAAANWWHAVQNFVNEVAK